MGPAPKRRRHMRTTVIYWRYTVEDPLILLVGLVGIMLSWHVGNGLVTTVSDPRKVTRKGDHTKFWEIA